MDEILIVDDNETVTRALTQVLTREGFQPVACGTGQDALTRAEQTGPPAAAVIDVHLPDINGLVLSQKLRERFGPHVPIIVVSGDTSTETIKSLPHVGATYFFSKPVSAQRLIGRLRELMTATPAPDQSAH